MTLEAAILFPVFLAFVFMLILQVRILAVETALQSAANETVKQLSGVWVPFEEPLKQTGQTMDKLDPSEWSFIPDTVKPLLESFGSWKGLPDQAFQQTMAVGLKPVVWSNIPGGWKGTLLNQERLKIKGIAVPYITNGRLLFGFELHYTLPISLPFYHKEKVIRKRAYERVWFGA